MSATRAGAQNDLRRTGRSPEPAAVSPRLYGALAAAAPTDGRAFFTLQFGTATGSQHSTVVQVPLAPLAGSLGYEVWTGPPVTRREVFPGGGYIAGEEHLGLVIHSPTSGEADMAEVTRQLYRELLRRQRELDYPHMVRMWTVVPGINDGEGDAETYVRFNLGRAAAFDELALPESRYSAATCVGSPAGSPLTLLALASRVEPVSIENPRQVSAYQYPRQYGPRAPSFARATLLRDAGGATLFISGTASIVGHESRHDSVLPQIAETLNNLRELRARALAAAPDLRPAGRCSWRVYLRDPADVAAAREAVSGELGGPEQVLYLRADVCRRELKVEVEGVCELLAPGH
jgi:chorismate lyase/3-hydroxybenzoate synthase